MITTKNKKFNSYQYLGAIHIHSKFSDGTGDINSISKAAKKAGLDWIIITDHNSFEIEEGFYNSVCVIKGEEISPQKINHYLALGINEHIHPTTPSKFMEEVKKQGGFGFAAHPDEGTNRKNRHVPIRWTDKNMQPDGIEIWNWFSQWGDNLNDKNIFGLIYAYLFKNNLVKKPDKETLNWWDKLNNESREIIPAIGGVDAHALKIKDYVIPVTIFPYEAMFKTITNVLTFDKPLSEDFKIRKTQILEAIKNGNVLVVNRAVDNSIPQLNFVGGKTYSLENLPYLNIKTNKKSSIKLIHNGKELCHELANKCHLLLKEVGKYRVEIEIKDKGFAYSNPILVD